MKKTTANWLATADYDLQTAEAMLKSKRYLYVIFMCHLALEKMLKALWAEGRPEYPPRTHDLLLLVRKLDLALPKRDLRFLGLVADASVPTRYPEDLKGLVKEYPRRTAASFLQRTRRVMKWLRCQPPLAGT
jgi:HEPN domain-containing protein